MMIRLAFALLVAAGSLGAQGEFADHVRAALKAREEQRLDDAARELRAAAKLNPNVAEVYLNLGMVEYQRKHWPAAVEALEIAIKLKPGAPGARGLLGFNYLMLGRVMEALENLEAEYKEDPSNPDTNLWLGLAYLEAGDPRRAIARMEEARKADPQDLDLLFYLARAYQQVSLELYGAILNIDPESARARLAMAEDHLLNGRKEAALEEYERVLETEPGMPGVNAVLAELYADTGDYVLAEKTYRRELEVNPEHARINYRYGLVLLQLGRADDAIRHLKKAVSGDRMLLDAQFELGRALLLMGKLAEAETALLAVVSAETAPEKTRRSSHYQLGQLYRQQGKREEAARHLREFQELRAK
jgi:tetratricopeptide (TPR) repeat protein